MTKLRGKVGSALAGALLVITIALLATFVVAGSSVINLQLAQRAENGQAASLLAHSLIHQAIAELGKNISFSGDLQMTGVDSASSATLTFSPSSGRPYSTNNASGSQPLAWNKSQLLQNAHIPAQRVHLLAVGTSNNVQRTVEAVINVPSFTTSLASTGRVSLEKSIVGALRRVSDANLVSADPSLLQPGDLETNSNDPHSVNLTGGSIVTGNLQSCGPVNVSSDSRVQGEVRCPWTPASIPSFRVSDYDPALNGVLNYRRITSATVGPQNAVGLVRADSSLVISGDLDVDNCLFYVSGNLTVTGGIKGTGAVVVNGSVLVSGGSGLSSDDCVALMASGNLTLDSNTDCQINGMLYTQGDFSARHFTIVGSFIAQGATPGQGNVLLQDSQLYYVDVDSKLSMFAPRQIVIQVAGMNPPFNATLPPPSGVEDSLRYANWPNNGISQQPGVPDVLWVTPAQAAAHVNGQDLPGYNKGSQPWGWFDPVVVSIQQEKGALVYYITYKSAVAVQPDNGQTSPERYSSHTALVTRLTDLGQAMCSVYFDGQNGHGNYTSHHDYWDMIMTSFEEQIATDPTVRPNYSIDPNKFLSEQQKIRITALTEY